MGDIIGTRDAVAAEMSQVSVTTIFGAGGQHVLFTLDALYVLYAMYEHGQNVVTSWTIAVYGIWSPCFSQSALFSQFKLKHPRLCFQFVRT